MLFEAHAWAFVVFGGVTKRGIYDNKKTAVDKVGEGKKRIVNARFETMTGHYLFDPEFCNRASGWEKGIVELRFIQPGKPVQNAYIESFNSRFRDECLSQCVFR